MAKGSWWRTARCSSASVCSAFSRQMHVRVVRPGTKLGLRFRVVHSLENGDACDVFAVHGFERRACDDSKSAIHESV
jgi:hypothetical protein